MGLGETANEVQGTGSDRRGDVGNDDENSHGEASGQSLRDPYGLALPQGSIAGTAWLKFHAASKTPRKTQGNTITVMTCIPPPAAAVAKKAS